MSIFYTPDSITSFQQVVINNAHRPIFVTNSANLYNTGATFSRSRGYEKKKVYYIIITAPPESRWIKLNYSHAFLRAPAGCSI